MPTIQVREIPADAYEVIRSRARSEGKSIQAYMRDRVIEMASNPSKAEALARIAALAERYGEVDVSAEGVVAHVNADRR